MASNIVTICAKKSTMTTAEPDDLYTHKSIEVFKLNSISYRAEVTQAKDGRMYIGLARHWLSPQSGTWVPTKKSMFMPIAAWRSMKQAVALVDDTLEELMPRTSKPDSEKFGMFYYHSIIIRIYYLLLILTAYINSCFSNEHHNLFFFLSLI